MSVNTKAKLSTVFKLAPGTEVEISRFEQHEVGYSFELDEDGHPLVLVQVVIELKAETE